MSEPLFKQQLQVFEDQVRELNEINAEADLPGIATDFASELMRHHYLDLSIAVDIEQRLTQLFLEMARRNLIRPASGHRPAS